MTRLFWKLFLALWLSIMAFSAVNAWFYAHIIENQLLESGIDIDQRILDELHSRFQTALEEQGPDAIRRGLQRLPRGLERRVFIVTPDGREMLGRDRVIQSFGNRRVASERIELKASDGSSFEMIVVGRPPPLPLMTASGKGVLHRLMLSAFISALVSLFLARYLSRPLETLSATSRSLAGGDMSARVGSPLVDRRDEFGGLARDFDHMAGHLQDLQAANQTLLRDVSHELRSPLARLRVALEIARERDTGQVSNELDRIELESERLEALIDQVLDLLRETSGPVAMQMESIELPEMLQDLQELVSFEAGQKLKIGLDCEPGLSLLADRELIWRAVENLVRNSIRHSPADGKVMLVGERTEQAAIVIRVLDNGPGIPESSLAQVFDPFFRVHSDRDRQTGGHGLGLAIAAAAVRRHGGQLTAHNRPEGGLEMRLQLPAA